jgi:hypothetical protein
VRNKSVEATGYHRLTADASDMKSKKKVILCVGILAAVHLLLTWLTTGISSAQGIVESLDVARRSETHTGAEQSVRGDFRFRAERSISSRTDTVSG